ncbi:LOG family protein [Lentisalinibacter orientalis]|uniref:LOG family protein n=1 Tax=Lentisalinibacter orientalis TaxID=2992241 RepID=UPI0038655879
MATMKSICVFAGSSSGTRPVYASAAEELGRAVAERGWRVVYGGGRVGLMGVLADAALAAGGEVIGVIPEALLRKEVGHRGLTDLRVVQTMHQRKALMSELSDGVVALPGGLGTLEELFEILTWAQLGIHARPCGVLNAGGYYDELLRFLDQTVSQGFVRGEHRDMILAAGEAAALLDLMADYTPRYTAKWMDRDET